MDADVLMLYSMKSPAGGEESAIGACILLSCSVRNLSVVETGN